uniref:solute carrier family 22 member 6-A-like n=1 Tax=Euleptes europaea TaxID=460621 RepID=UPI002540F023|nr:solute carrier family 22 member 6-A-like [Euleptes europaea]
MSFAELLEHVGGMGRFQIVYVTFLAIPVFMMASHNILQNFTAATPEHHCLVHHDAIQENQSLTYEDLVQASIPMDERQQREECLRFVSVQWGLLNPNASNVNRTEMKTEMCNDGWTYNRSIFPNTIVTEWNLVCASRSLKQMAQSLYMAGVLLGGIVFGGLSDRFGRRSLLIWCYLQMAVMGSATAFSPSFSFYCAFRFLTGMAFSGIVLNCVSLSVEWTPTNTRAVVGTLNGYAYTTGQFILVGVAYLIRDWRWLQLTVSLPYFVFFFYSWWFAESARWLVMVKKLDRAVKELKRVARINGKEEAGDKLNIETLRSKMKEEIATAKSTYTIADLVRTPTMRRISCCLCFVWFSTSFAYYGLVMDLQNFGVNIYMVQLIFGAVDFPAKLISVLSICFIGRRFTQAVTLILAGMAILANIFVPQGMQTLRTVFAVFGKGCLAASFNCVYLYTGELYPTVLRQTGMGLSNTMARSGAIIAPLVKMIGEYIPFLPMVIYGVAPIVSGVAAAFLPETLNVPLRETIEQVEIQSQLRKDEKKQTKTLLSSTKPETEKVTS